MTICIDIRNLAQKNHSGVGVYTMELINNLLEIDKENQYKLFYNSKKYQLIKKYYSNVTYYDLHKSNRLLNLTMFLFNRPKIDRLVGGCDVFFAPNINFFALSFRNKKIKTVITIHDLSFLFFKKFYSPKSLLWHNVFINVRRIINKFDHIIAVSENTKSDIIKYFNINEKKVTAIHLGTNIYDTTYNKSNIRKEILDINTPYILNINTLEPRKNVDGIISAFSILKEDNRFKNVTLIIAGARGWNGKSIYKIVAKNKFKNDIKIFDYINNGEKIYLYKNAKLFLFPSFYEGFGFPIIEAQALGIPVITSANSSLSEISNSSTILVNPNNTNEIVFAIKEILSDEILYKLYKELGEKNYKEYQWEETAKKTLDVFRKM